MTRCGEENQRQGGKNLVNPITAPACLYTAPAHCQRLEEKRWSDEDWRITINLVSDDFDWCAGVKRSFTDNNGSPRGLWTRMHHISDLTWSYPTFARIHRVVKDIVRKKWRIKCPFLKNKINFLKNYWADWAEIFSRARSKKSASNETNPKIFSQLEEELWFYEDLNISMN